MNRVFHAHPFCRPPEELAAILEENPEFLGKGWKFLGRGNPGGEGKEEEGLGQGAALLFAAPEGDLVICLLRREVDGALLSRGLSLLGAAREALGFLAGFRMEGWPPLKRARLLLLGGVAERQVLSAAGEEVSVLLVSEVEGQPGPPLVIGEPPLKEEGGSLDEMDRPGIPGPPGEEESRQPWEVPGPGRDAPPLDDEEMARLIG